MKPLGSPHIAYKVKFTKKRLHRSQVMKGLNLSEADKHIIIVIQHPHEVDAESTDLGERVLTDKLVLSSDVGIEFDRFIQAEDLDR